MFSSAASVCNGSSAMWNYDNLLCDLYKSRGVTASTADVDEDPVTFYLGYYDWSISRRLYLSDFG